MQKKLHYFRITFCYQISGIRIPDGESEAIPLFWKLVGVFICISTFLKEKVESYAVLFM